MVQPSILNLNYTQFYGTSRRGAWQSTSYRGTPALNFAWLDALSSDEVSGIRKCLLVNESITTAPFHYISDLLVTNFFFYRCTVHFEIYPVHSPTNVLFSNLVKILNLH